MKIYVDEMPKNCEDCRYAIVPKFKVGQEEAEQEMKKTKGGK